MAAKSTLNAPTIPAENADVDLSHLPISTVVAPQALTLRQVQVLRCVEQWIDSRGWPPSLSELCVMLGTPSKAVIVDHLEALQRKGYVRRDAGERRGLQVLIAADRAPLMNARPIKKARVLCDRCKRECG